MQIRNLGRSGLRVPRLCLGTMMFGAWGNRNVDECVRIIHRALDAGLYFIDTANIYSGGECEEIVGRALRDRREDVVLATKVFGAMGRGEHRRGLSRKAIQEQVEHSLRRLGTDVIDLYQIHRPDPLTPWQETLAALDDLVRQGKVRYLGCSTNHWDTGDQKRMPAWEIVETLWLAEREGRERFVSIQPPYSMLRRTMELEHFPMALRHGLGNVVWSPLEGGWLAGKYRRGNGNPEDSPRARDWVGDIGQDRFDRRLNAVEALIEVFEGRDDSLAEIALAWTLRHEAVTSAIIGPRTMEQLDSCLRATEIELTDEEMAAVDRVVAPGTSVL